MDRMTHGARRLLLACALMTAAGCGGGSSKSGGDTPTPTPGDFSSSFEVADVQPDWSSETERVSNVSPLVGLPGSLSARGLVTDITASSQYNSTEIAANLLDNDPTTKWLASAATGSVVLTLLQPVAVTEYAITSANDASDRDPKAWTLSGSTDGTTWVALDSQSGQTFAARYLTQAYAVTNTEAYAYYKLEVTTNNGSGSLLQFADLDLGDGVAADLGMVAYVGKGPSSTYTYTNLAGAGFTGLHSLRYAGQHVSDGPAHAAAKVFDVDLYVGPDTQLSYEVFPEFTASRLDYPSTYVAVDLAFTDGTYLSDLGAVDQHGTVLSPQAQGASKALYANQWNRIVSRIGAVAAGKTIDRILVAYQRDGAAAAFSGWVDDVQVTGEPATTTRTRPSEWVITTRGTNSNGTFSRGNNAPLAAVPHGFNFWAPVTDAGSLTWLYTYQQNNNSENLPALQAFSCSHEPSPWIGDRQTFQVMPAPGDGVPSATRAARALPFHHANEIAQAHYYSVIFDDGVRAELTPTDHAAMFRFTFTGDSSSLIFDNAKTSAGYTLDVAGNAITGYSDVNYGYPGTARMYMYATFDPAPVGGSTLGGNSGTPARYLRFDTSAGKVVTMRIATSLISVEQAKKNLALEIAASDTFDTVKERAQALWDEKLGVIEVEGASDDQLTSLYSSLYRLNLYPNSGFENTGTADAPVYRHAVQSTTTTSTAPAIADGKVYVNNGFWDTYRTAWPAYALLYPSDAAEMVDGFVQQYRDGGWVARWSTPGYGDCMTGTSSDVAFADAYVKGVTGFDAEEAYAAGLKNGTVYSSSSNTGRKGIATSIFLGYTPSSTSESASWSLEGFINDFGLARMAAALAADSTVDAAHRARYAEEAEYFLNRSRSYASLFDPDTGFLRGRKADGTWYLGSGVTTYDPRAWGYDYTETDGWNFAFHAPHDGLGLALLLGGKAALAAKLDAFFADQETALYGGSYGGTIHEMREARDVRMGQWGASNQVSHHIPYMYAYAGQPWKAQAIVREALRRLFVGSEIGQGYPGDEDNGEMSAWYVFSALGLYPLQVGSPYYVIGSPLFTKATVHLENGHDLIISAPGNSQANVYVQGLTVNGVASTRTYVSHADLIAGTTLEFAMGSTASTWGSGDGDAPPSITTGAKAPVAMADVTGSGAPSASTAVASGSLANLFDNSSATEASFSVVPTDAAPLYVYYDVGADAEIGLYTITSNASDATADVASWTLYGSEDGSSWTPVDTRAGQTFAWRRQTRPFALASLATYRYFALAVTANAGSASTTSLAELELLTDPLRAP